MILNLVEKSLTYRKKNSWE